LKNIYCYIKYKTFIINYIIAKSILQKINLRYIINRSNNNHLSNCS